MVKMQAAVGCRVHFNAPQLKTAVILDLLQTLSNKQHMH